MNPIDQGYPEDPWELVRDWLPANDDPVRPTMTVATVADGMPDARTLLLSEYDARGFFFHTDSRSRKVEQLAANPAVALMLHLPADQHQLVVQGVAEPADDAELARAYRRRSPYLQQLAWQNTIEFAGLTPADREADWAAFTDAHADGFSAPPTWTGYLVRPSRLTFWFGSDRTASRRVEYAAGPDGWTVSFRAG